MESALRRRATVKANLTRLNNYVEGLAAQQPINHEELQVRVGLLETYWERFEQIQEEIEELCPEELLGQQELERQEFETRFFQTKVLCNRLSRVTPAEGVAIKTQVKLPQINLPNFGGNYVEWRSFHDLFIALIHNNKDLQPVQQLQYLKGCLVGDALNVIQSIPVVGVNYEKAWQLICQRYNNPKQIVAAHFKGLLEQPSVTIESAIQLRGLLDRYREHVSALETLEANVFEKFIVYLMTNRLDKETRRQWEMYSTEHQDLNFERLQVFVERRCQALDATPQAAVWSQSSNKTKVQGVRSTRTMVTHALSCVFCQGTHSINACNTFGRLSVEQRLAKVREKRWCFNCLRMDHQARDCRAGNCRQCHKRHHTLLHFDNHKKANSLPADSPLVRQSEDTNPTLSVLCHFNQAHTILPTASVRVSKARSNWSSVRALLDGCSQSNFVTLDLVNRLNLKQNPISTSVMGLGLAQSITAKTAVWLHIKDHQGGFSKQIMALAIPAITDNLPITDFKLLDESRLQGKNLADPEFNRTGRIDLLLGTQICMEINPASETSGLDQPWLIPSKLGWIVAGETNMLAAPTVYSCLTTIGDFDLQRFWELEGITETRQWTQEESDCEKHFVETHRRNPSGRYVVSLPVKSDGRSLGMSKGQAIRRWFHQERKLSRLPEQRQDYHAFLSEYERLGHMEEVPLQEKEPEVCCYLPHHAVFKEKNGKTKIRVVFDASAVTSSGISLNQMLMIGPTIQDSLCDILIRFRARPIAMIADIEKMYRQISLSPEDRDYQRIVWRPSIDHQLKTYRLTTVTYGTACAPFLATRTLSQLADDEALEFPQAARTIKEDFYIDDCLTGVWSVEEAITLKNDLVNVMERGGFHLCGWASNSELVVGNQAETVQMTGSDSVSTLGLEWGTRDDTFSFPCVLQQCVPVTKRIILSMIARIYDPLGLLSPVTIRMKCFLQQLWQDKLEWDTAVQGYVLKEWEEIVSHLDQLKELKIPRCVVPFGASSSTLMGYCDASEKAYAAAVFLHSTDGNSVMCRLVSAKTRVAPLKVVSVPRLELCGAVLLAQLITQIQRALKMNIDSVKCFSDSQITVAWIRSEPSRWKTFVANRVATIHRLTSPSCWYHISGSRNPADLATRGLSVSELIESHLWWTGTMDGDFGQNVDDGVSYQTALEERQISRVNSTQTKEPNKIFSLYSSLSTLLRTVAWMRRFGLPAARQYRGDNCLGVQELKEARDALIRLAQRESFHQEIQDLSQNGRVDKRSSLLRLNPFLDSSGMLRVGGRLQNADIPNSQKHPMILRGDHLFTKLLIREEHLRHLHAQITLLLTVLRRQFWIVKAKWAVKKCISNCIPCWKLSAQPMNQIMAPLPAARVRVARVFSEVGIDYAGPLTIRARYGRGKPVTSKGYVVLFVCFATRAIHLEAASDLTTDTFIAVLRRFIGRRGKPRTIWSDRGSNFIGAAALFKKLPSSGQDFAHMEGIKWHFSPASSPHFGGIWEAGVRSAKMHLRRTMQGALLTFEQLTTVLVQIEACLNSRPLCASTSMEDFDPLTPGHFLIGSPITSLPEPDLTKLKGHLLRRWELVQAQVRGFWNRWSHDYLHTLQQRSCWKIQQPDIQVNELVLLKETCVFPTQWKLARVVEVHPGADGHIRVVTLKTPTGLLTRSIHKLCRLPRTGDEEND